MKYSFLSCMLICCAVLGLVSQASGQSEAVPSLTKDFTVGFQQDGHAVPVINHQVQLKKKSFTIVIYYKRPSGVLVNASLSSESFTRAQARRPLSDLPGFSDLGMAEESFNPKALLMLSAQAPHYWYYEHEADHRFNDVSLQDGVLQCRRIVAQVMDRDGTKTVLPVAKLSTDTLYLVFIKARWTPDFRQQIEEQREYVKVLFR